MKSLSSLLFPKKLLPTPKKCFLSLLALYLVFLAGPAHQVWGQSTTLFYSGFEQGHSTLVYGAGPGFNAPAPVLGSATSGSYASKISGASGYNGSIATGQTFALEPDVEYEITFFAKVTGGSGKIQIIRSNGTSFSEVESGEPVGTAIDIINPDYGTSESRIFYSTSSATEYLAFLLQSSNGESMFLDDIRIRATCQLNSPVVSPLLPRTYCKQNAPAGTIDVISYEGSILKWQSSTDLGKTWTDINNTTTTLSYPTLSKTTYFRALAGSPGGCQAFSNSGIVEINDGTVRVTVEASATQVCAGNPITFTATAANVGTSPSYQWKVGSNNILDNNYPTYTFTPTLQQSGEKVTVTVTSSDDCSQNNPGTSDPIQITVSDSGPVTWLGNTSDWFDPGNWTGCVPNETVDVVIPVLSAGKVMPEIGAGGTAKVKNLEMNSALRLADGANLEVFGAFSGTGSVESHPESVTKFGNSAAIIPPGSYGTLELLGSSQKELAGPVLVKTRVDLTNGSLYLGSHSLTLSNSSMLTGYSSTRYVVQDGEGRLQINGLGDGWGGFFPVGTGTGYSPAALLNNGAPDGYSVRVLDELREGGLTGALIEQQAVRKTWDLQEAVTGGSDATLTLQWSAQDEAPGFEQFEAHMAIYTPGGWNRLTSTSPGVETVGDGQYAISHSGLKSLSLFGVVSGESLPLPVLLAYFRAEKQGHDALLKWETVTETDNAGFGVEASTDGEQFREIGFVKSNAPNSQSRLQYTFLDRESGKSGTRYYRLRQTDLDGTLAYSAIQAVTFEGGAGLTVLAFPNPFREAVALDIASDKAQPALLQLRDALGREMLSRQLSLQAGLNRQHLELGQEYSTGIYYLSLYVNGQVYHTKLLKQ